MKTKQTITVNLPLIALNFIQEMIDSGEYESRSQVVRVILTEFLQKEKDYLDILNSKPDKCERNIVTVNVPVEDIEFMKQFVKSKGRGLYPSRSEVLRVAFRDFIIKEIYIRMSTLISEVDPNILVENKGKKWRLK